MIRKSFFASALFFLLLLQSQAQVQISLPRSTPEAEGVSSKSILDFLDAAAKSNNEFHSIVYLRHGKVIAEGWWKPYAPELKHTMYSVSKSFTATAVGFAIAEKKLNLTDKVISFFPDALPDSVSDNLSQLNIRNLLTMAVGQEPDPSFRIAATEIDWVRSFLKTPIQFKPGSQFLYNSFATYTLSAIVQKVTGQKVIEYLQSRLFDPLGIKDIDWEVDLNGVNTGGWGLRIRTEDMAKFGQLFLQKGKWNNKQILPESWINDASGVQIMQHPEFTQEQRDKSDWEQGYGFQMWRSRNNSYRADGAYGQYILVLPEKDVVIAITSETANMGDELELVWKHLLPGMSNSKLKTDSETGQLLTQRLKRLALPIPVNASDSTNHKPVAAAYSMQKNPAGIQKLSFDWKDNNCILDIQADTANYKIIFGAGEWEKGETSKWGPSLVYFAKGHMKGLPASIIAGAYRWRTNKILELTLRYIDSPHTERFEVEFDENKINLTQYNSQDFGKKGVQLRGELIK